jgi:cobaltochelatase CobS
MTTTTVEIDGIRVGAFDTPQDPDYAPPQEVFVDPHGYKKRLAHAWANNQDTLLLGPTGVGKTALIRHMCGELNRAYRRFACHEATDVNSLLGKLRLDGDGTYFQEGIVYDATKRGHVLNLDEYNAAHPDVRLALNPLHVVDEGILIVAENEGEVVPRHPDFRLVATGNPHHYAGLKEWNPASLSRFDNVIWMDYLPSAEEVKLLRSEVPKLKSDHANAMVKAGNACREAYTEEVLRYPVSYREVRNWAMASETFGIAQAAEMTLVSKMEPDDQKMVRNDLLKSAFPAGDWK